MPRVCVLLADGFEEIEAITVIDVLRRAEIEVVTLAVPGTGDAGLDVRGSHGVQVRTDRGIDTGAAETWDMVILPGGLPGATNLRDSEAVQALIKKQQASGKKLGAICAAPIALARAGVLQGRKATCFPGFENDLEGATFLTHRVVRDGNIVTSRGPGTAFDFAFEIAAELAGKAVAEKLRAGMLVAV